MRRLAPLLILILTGLGGAATREIWLPPAKYGTAYTLYFALEDSNNAQHFYETAPAAADVHVFQDGASEAQAANVVTDLGRSFKLVLTATEMQARVVTVDINDATAPALFCDAIFYIPTFGNVSAYHVCNYDKDVNSATEIADAVWEEPVTEHTTETTYGAEVGGLDPNITLIKAMTDLLAVVTTTVASATDANTFVLTAGQDVNDAYWMHAIMVEDGTDGHAEVRWIETYVTSRTVTVDRALSFTPAGGDKAWILGPVYGGFLTTLETMLKNAQSPIYYFNRSSGTTGASGVTYIQQQHK